MCVQEPCVYLLSAASVVIRNRYDAHLRRGHNDQSHWGHQWSETRLIGESRFHISTPFGIEPGSLMTGSKQVDHWTSGTVYECSEITGSPHIYIYTHTNIHRCIYIYISRRFSLIQYRSPIMQLELSVYWRRNKQKLSICKRTKRTCLSMVTTELIVMTELTVTTDSTL